MARRYHYSGVGFTLGQDELSYAIWHRGLESGPPVAAFALDESGWNQAYATLMAWDPSAAQLPSDPLQTAEASVTLYQAPTNIVAPAYPNAAVTAPWGNNVPAQPSNGLATAGGAIGITGAALSLIPLLGIAIGILAGILAIVFGSIGLSKSGRTHTGKGMAVTGLVLGILTVIFKLIPGVNLL